MSGSNSNVLAVPVIPQPQQPSDVVGLVLQNPGSTALAAREITFAEVFAPGQVPAGSQLVATVNGQKLPVQTDVKTANPDGSVGMAVLTMTQPVLAANSSANVMLSLAPAGTTVPAALNLAQAISGGGYNVAVNLALHNGTGTTTPYTFNVGSLLQQALTSGTVTYWMNGSQATEASFSVPVSGSLRMVFNVTAYADGSFATDVQFNNDIAMQASGGTAFYDATITQNGQTVSQQTNLTQYQYQDWHQTVYSNGAPGVNVQHDIAALEKLGIIQNYDLTTGLSSSAIAQEQTMMSSPGWEAPLSPNGVNQSMGDTGGRADIGPTTGYATNWLLTQDETSQQMALGWADAADAAPWHFYDPSEGSYVSVTNIPDIWTDARGGPQSYTTGLTQMNVGDSRGSSIVGSISNGTLTATTAGWPLLYPQQVISGPGIPPGTMVVKDGTGTGGTGTYILNNPSLTIGSETIAYGSGWGLDGAHQPDLSFDAYVLTGDQHYLDQLNAQASYSESDWWPADVSQGGRGSHGEGLIVNVANQVRGMAWGIREIDEAAWANPDGSAEKTYFTQMENNNWSWLVSQLPTWTAQEGQAHGYIPGNDGGSFEAPWQQAYFLSSAVQAAEMGNKDAATVVQWMNNFFAGSFLNAQNGFSPYNGFDYELAIKDSTGSYYTTWSQMEQATQASGYGYHTNPLSPTGDYAELTLTALAGEITVTASPLAIKAYGWMNAICHSTGWITQAGYAGSATGWGDGGGDPQFNIVPLLPDGNSLTNGDVHVFNSATAGTLSASGTDQLIYDLGSANDTIIGGSGTNMLFAGSGNDLLIANGTDNYLFANTGTDTLVGGAGANYLDASGVSTVIGAAASGPATFSLSESISATDEIADFKVATDHLAITDSSGHLVTDAEIKSLISGATVDASGNVVLNLSPVHTTTLDGISLASLAPSIFVSGGSTVVNNPTITGAAFNDLNADGAWQSGESAAAGITVDLLSNGTVEATTTTASNGSYSFGNLVPGTYELEFVPPAGEKFSPAGTSATLPDSVVNTGGISPAITLTDGQLVSGEEAGLFVPGTISGAAFNDLNADGAWQSGESAAAGITVDLLSNGAVEATTTTASSGAYSFRNLTPGTYGIQFVAPPGELFSPQGTSTSLPDSIVNSSGAASIAIGAGQTVSGEDAGLLAAGMISGAAFDDLNADGVWQSGESAAAGITVDLLNNGTVEATTTTASNGGYSFGNLTPGMYEIEFVAPSGEAFSPQGTSTSLPNSVNSSGVATIAIGAGQTVSGEDVGLYIALQTIDLTTTGHTVQGGTRLLTIIDSAGGNSIVGGSGGLNLRASAGADTVSTSATATDQITLSTGGGLSSAMLINSNGSDTISITGRTANIFGNGPATVVTETKATIYMTETVGGQHATATVSGGAATLIGGLGQSGIKIIATKGAKVTRGNGAPALTSGTAGDTVSTTVPQVGGTISGSPAKNPNSIQKAGSSFADGGQAGTKPIFLGSGDNLVTTDGSDTVMATTGNDTVVAGNNNALVFGGSSGKLTFVNGSGASTVVGGSGSVTAIGGNGRLLGWAGPGGGELAGGSAGGNCLYAGSGAATLLGGGNNDVLMAAGSAGNLLAAGSGAETLTAAGSSGSNLLFGNDGADLLIAGRGADTLVGGAGSATLCGGSGTDWLIAGSGTTVAVAGSGNDTLFGGSGTGTFYFGSGKDVLIAGSGADVLVFTNGMAGSHVVWGFGGADRISLSGYGAGAVASAVANQVDANGNSTLALPDGTNVVFAGVAHLSAQSFL